MSKYLYIDGMNFLHRARSGWKAGPAPVVFNFLRSFRSIVDMFSPTRVFFVLEGHPAKRKELFKEYKENRVVDPESDDAVDLKFFYEQVNEITSLLSTTFPVSVVRHPHHECDDTIYNLIKRAPTDIQHTVVSNDSDFTQLLNEFNNVRIWNPMKKVYVEIPGYDYVIWKSLRGDSSDNIPGIRGIGDVRAETMARDIETLQSALLAIDGASEVFERNHDLIKFADWGDSEFDELQSSYPRNDDYAMLRTLCEKYGFRSILEQSAWLKLTNTFKPLWTV